MLYLTKMLVVQATQHHVVEWWDSEEEERTWKDAVMPNEGTEKNLKSG